MPRRAISPITTFVSMEAAQSLILPASYWVSLVSTDTVSALSNVACSAACMAAPIYDTQGNLVANSTADLFAGHGAAFWVDQFGNYSGNYSWSGSYSDGSIAAGYAAGDSMVNVSWPVYGGEWDVGNDSSYGYNVSSTDSFPLTALSTDQVTGAPEPASLSILAGGMMVLALARRRRAARMQRAG